MLHALSQRNATCELLLAASWHTSLSSLCMADGLGAVPCQRTQNALKCTRLFLLKPTLSREWNTREFRNARIDQAKGPEAYANTICAVQSPSLSRDPHPAVPAPPG